MAKMPSFRDFTRTTTDEFYRADPGSNDGPARYLCSYLQEQGLLVGFYQDFRDHVADDPTGFAALQRALSTKDLEVFKKGWEAWVLGLSFPG